MTIFVYSDIVQYIAQFLMDKEKVSLSKCSKILNSYEYIFTNPTLFWKICHIGKYNNFTHLVIDETFVRLYSSQSICGCKTTIKFPRYITRITFADTFDESINFLIPRSVTHLRFGLFFNKSIKYSIPPSVTHLRFGTYFNKSIKNSIPPSVTHLIFGYHFYQSIEDIPTTVKYIKLHQRHKTATKEYKHLKIKFF